MTDRREIRRSSPDAPQGYVPVLTVFAALLVVAVVAGSSFLRSDSSSPTPEEDDSAVVDDRVEEHGPTTGVPTTVTIRGSTTTALFVTTTTPITTTTSTTTTTLPGPPLAVSGSEIVFAPGQTTATFTIRSAHPEGIDFEITRVPPGFEVNPDRGSVAEDRPAEAQVKLVDADRARSGTMRIEGSDGSRATVTIRIGHDALAIRSIRLEPSPPVCRTRSRLVVEVAGDDVRSVTARIRAGGSESRLELSRSSGSTWSGSVPGGPAGATLSGTVTAVDAAGGSATDGFSATIARGPECADE